MVKVSLRKASKEENKRGRSQARNRPFVTAVVEVRQSAKRAMMVE